MHLTAFSLLDRTLVSDRSAPIPKQQQRTPAPNHRSGRLYFYHVVISLPRNHHATDSGGTSVDKQLRHIQTGRKITGDKPRITTIDRQIGDARTDR